MSIFTNTKRYSAGMPHDFVLPFWREYARMGNMIITLNRGMDTMEEIKEKLRAFIQEKFEIDDDPDFTDDVHLFNEGFVDSFGAVEIIHFIEQTYNIEITQKDITLYPMNTIEEIAEVVENKLS